MSTKNTWDKWEVLAIKYLQKYWYNILTTNFRFKRFWEIDIIWKIDGITVFIEVKYRLNNKYWLPEESITKNKLRKCKKTIDFYLKKYNISYELIRCDVISIQKQTTSYKLKHYKNIEIW
jgi:putative endonuclease